MKNTLIVNLLGGTYENNNRFGFNNNFNWEYDN